MGSKTVEHLTGRVEEYSRAMGYMAAHLVEKDATTLDLRDRVMDMAVSLIKACHERGRKQKDKISGMQIQMDQLKELWNQAMFERDQIHAESKLKIAELDTNALVADSEAAAMLARIKELESELAASKADEILATTNADKAKDRIYELEAELAGYRAQCGNPKATAEDNKIGLKAMADSAGDAILKREG